MTNILAIDTATKNLMITINSNKKIYTTSIDEGFTHSEMLLLTISDLLTQANIGFKDLNLLICTRGPGSFTGLRIGIATLKGVSLGLNIPLVSIPTLDSYAFSNSVTDGIVMPIIDARKKCFYTAIYRNNIKESIDLDLTVSEIENIISKENYITLVGPDCELLYSKLNDNSNVRVDNEYIKNRGEKITQLGITQFNLLGPDSLDQGPVYIRKSEAEIHLNNKKKPV